jgi:phosphoheptose isomerase
MKASEHFKPYITQLIDALVTVDAKVLDNITDELISAFSNGSDVFVCGNGGSSAISNHWVCDHSKGVCTDTDMLPQVQDLSSTSSVITAIANDIGYEEIFSYQLRMKAKSGDVLIAISSSGNSPNIIKAITKARQLGMVTVALVGFDGGTAKNIADHVIHVNNNNYGVVEDAHQSLMHIIAQSIRLTHLNKETIKL